VTDKLVVGTGIANVWKRQPITMSDAARALAEIFPDRLIPGFGVNQGPMMAQLGLTYEKPVAFMREHLASIKAAPYSAPRPASDPPISDRGLDAEDVRRRRNRERFCCM
jgi:alkanesulfonate monooxygenase SsuD/methylene tetrahydromethanopterin reductase-like flavin-dependent oxidoreductase (luciferase family)